MKKFWYVFVKTEYSVWSDYEKNTISIEDNSVFNNIEYKFYNKDSLQEYIINLQEILDNEKEFNVNIKNSKDIYKTICILSKLLKEIPSNKGVIINCL